MKIAKAVWLHLTFAPMIWQPVESLSTLTHPGLPDHYVKLLFENNVAYGQKEFFGWCVDNSRGISAGALDIPVNFLCSYNEEIDDCIVNKQENLGKANWIINNRDGYTWQTVQAAMWYLLSDATAWMSNATYSTTPYMELVNAADANFVPTECDQKVLGISLSNR